jgi:predicted transposase YbfD/YdcC
MPSAARRRSSRRLSIKAVTICWPSRTIRTAWPRRCGNSSPRQTLAGLARLPVSRHPTIGKDHGRIETRNHLWVSDLSWLDQPIRQRWPKLAGVGMVERTREINGKASTEQAFYIGSKGIAQAETFAHAARSHWGIENGLHWVLDVTFREDDCRVRKGHAPQNLSALRKFALTLLRQDQQYPKRSLRSRRKTADRIPDYRASLLGLAPRG